MLKPFNIFSEKGASLDTQEVNGNTALILASQNNHVSTARLLLKSGADLDNLVDVAGKSALAIALANGNLELVKLFLEERQANFECPSHFIGVNMACLNGQIEVLKAVIGQVDLAKRDGKAGNYTPLHYACQTAHIEVVALLLDHGADVNARADQGKPFTRREVGKENIIPILFHLHRRSYPSNGCLCPGSSCSSGPSTA